MQKQAGRAKSGLGTNYKMLIGVFVFFIFAIPSLLLFFEHKAYLSEKKSAAYRMQQDIDEKIHSVKTLVNYTFYDEDFQILLCNAETNGQEEYEKIYAHLTSASILGDIIKGIWYLPKSAENTVSADGVVVGSDFLTAYLADNLADIGEIASQPGYFSGEYFFHRLKAPGEKQNFSRYAAIGHWVLSTSPSDYFLPIGVGLALIDLSVLTESFSEIADMPGVNAVLLAEKEALAGTGSYAFGDWEKKGVQTITIDSRFFGLKTVLYYSSGQLLIDFLPTFAVLVFVLLFLCACFFFYIRMDDRRRLSSYQTFIDAFQKISEGELERRLEPCPIEGLNLVVSQFNQMMDSVVRLNEELAEQEKIRLNAELEKDGYILKYLSTQMNKHFIFNTFGTIRSFVSLKKMKEAYDCINWLCDYLRFTFKSKDYVSVREEIFALRSYLNIQQVRFPEISVEISVSSVLSDCKMPQFILQPVVENCYKHAFDCKRGKISVTGEMPEPGVIEFVISDDGKGVSEEELGKINAGLESGADWDPQGGIGLINVQRRLRLLSGKDASVRVVSASGGTSVKICFAAAGGEDAENLSCR